MKTSRKRRANSGGASRTKSGKRRAESTESRKRKTEPVIESDARPNSKVRDLPPNENIRKRADEVYGDTEIPERKPGT